MSKQSSQVFRQSTPFKLKPNRYGPLIFYALIIFFVRFGDAMMSYLSPIYIEGSLNDPLMMGIILSLSSVFGLICDVIFGEWFSRKSYNFFLFWGILVAILFPISYLLFPPWIMFFIVSMLIWGIYFELILFSDFHFVNHFLDHNNHDFGWGVIYAFIAAAYMLAPMLASSLLEIDFSLTLVVALALFLIALFGYFIFSRSYPNKERHSQEQKPKHKIKHVLKLWRVLFRPLWPVLFFIFIVWVLDAVFWTSGAIISEELKSAGLPGGILFVVYLFPALFMGFIASKIAKPFGKKRVAFVAGAISGLIFAVSGVASNPYLFVALIFFASIFLAIALPEINGAIEDYIERMGKSANSMISLENAITSISYIIGPIFAGIVAVNFGHQFTFSIIGVLMVIISIIAIIFTPRKIRLPQAQIKQVETENSSTT